MIDKEAEEHIRATLQAWKYLDDAEKHGALQNLWEAAENAARMEERQFCLAALCSLCRAGNVPKRHDGNHWVHYKDGTAWTCKASIFRGLVEGEEK